MTLSPVTLKQVMRLGANTTLVMGRWAPNTRERLELAALDLFEERGYDATSVADIAARAGLTKSTFFRQFADKREVLSGDSDELAATIRGLALAVPSSVGAIDAIAAALAARADAFTEERRVIVERIRAVVATSPELRERELLKRAALVSAAEDALLERGVDPITARLAAEFGILAFRTALARWSARAGDGSLAEIAGATLAELRERAIRLAS